MRVIEERDDIIEVRENTKIIINVGKIKLQNYLCDYKLLPQNKVNDSFVQNKIWKLLITFT